MATSSKFDMSTSSPDRPLYVSGQRGSHIAAPLDRSGSFRESMDNPILSSLPNMSRSTISTAQGDLMNFFHCMRFDPKVVAAEHKSLRQGDFKRHIHAALGLTPDESSSGSTKGKIMQSPSPEEIKRVKAVLRESGVKARERVKIFNEALSVFNKFFPTVPSKKRSRAEGFAADRSSAMLTSDRSGLGTNIGKLGIQNHSIQGSFEIDQQKSEERTKASLPNKRSRTSFADAKMDGRNNTLVRPFGALDREREMLRIANSGEGEDRTLSIGVDGWEKSKMKKKRSGIKADASPSTMLTKHVDGYRETKQVLQQRPIADARSKLNNDSHGFRPGVNSGVVGAGKSDGMSQQTVSGIRSSITRTEADNSPLMNDKRERVVALDKDRANLRTVNKTNARDESNSASPVSNAKGNSTVRGPRSNSGVPPKSSPVVYRTTVSNDWEISACPNKPPSGVGPNRKRMATARSSSPPVAHWAGQRPQKISRTARRSNLVAIVTSNDDTPAMDSPSDVTGNDNGLVFTKRMSGSSPQQVKIKGEPLSSAALSESEESGAAEIKSRDKGKKSDEVDEKGGQNVQKVSSLVLSSRKNKLVNGEDPGDGVRRQGRTGRGFSSTRNVMPMTVEKVGGVGTAKQLRTARHGFEKPESKAGRPPTRKLSDRKAYTRQKHSSISSTADFTGSDDGHDELLAAANAAANPALACSSPFWKQMEPYFGLISEKDITYLKQQGNLESTPLTCTPVPPNIDSCNPVSAEFGFTQCGVKSGESLSEQLTPGQGDHIPLYQRLMAALISEEDYSGGNEDFKGEAYESEFDVEELGIKSLDHQSLMNFQFSGHANYNGYSMLGDSEQNQPGTDKSNVHRTMNSNFSESTNGLFSDQNVKPSRTCSEFHYGNMPINDKLLLEIQSIGIFPETMPDMAQMGDEEISKEIGELEAQYLQQVSRRKDLMDGLLNSSLRTKEHQEKEFERRALEKLTTVAYEKYIACWGPNTSGKSSSNKIAKQAALACVKRTLEHCHTYEETGKSCFSEPLFRDIFLSRSNVNSARQADSIPDGESSKGFASIRSMEGRISGSHQSPSQFSQNIDNYDGCLDGPVSEQAIGKEDMWSNRGKKRELSLDDVGYNAGISNAPLGMGTSLASSAKGKRSERDRDGKGHNREVSSRNGTVKLGRPSLNHAKGERKKSKPKQKITQLSVSVNGLLGKMSEQQTSVVPSLMKSNELTNNSNAKGKDDFGLDALDDPESIDLSQLQIPGMDVLGADNLDAEGQDLGSWLNIDDEGLQDHDFMGGLEIPMDDLSDLNMMV